MELAEQDVRPLPPDPDIRVGPCADVSRPICGGRGQMWLGYHCTRCSQAAEDWAVIIFMKRSRCWCERNPGSGGVGTQQ